MKVSYLKLMENIKEEDPLINQHFELLELDENQEIMLQNEIKKKMKMKKCFD